MSVIAPDAPAASIRSTIADRLARLAGRARATGDESLAHRIAGTAFAIRVASAGFLFLTQIVFARWMGGTEFGHYVYVWTCVLVVGDLLHLGLASVAPRFIPLHAAEGRIDLLRGFIASSCLIVFAAGLAAAFLAALVVTLAVDALDPAEVTPLYLACAVLPAYALSVMLDAIARTHDRVALALLPPYFLRPLLIALIAMVAHAAGFGVDATLVMAGAVAATWGAMALQFAGVRRALARLVPPGPRAYEPGAWFGAAAPALMVLGFYTLLAYTDILVLRHYASPADIAIYYAATKTLALVAMIHFAVGAAVAHRFAEYHVAGETERLSAFLAMSVRMTFWPSLGALALVLALGWPILWLFGPDFVSGYPLMFVLGIGLMARASVGPAERLANMLGEQRACALVYGTAFAVNLGLCLVLVPRFGPVGAAASMATALCAESAMLAVLIRRRLGLRALIAR